MPRKSKKAAVEEIIKEDALLDEHADAEISEEAVLEEAVQEEYLTVKEKLIVWASVFASFMFFTILFLPYGLLTKKFVNMILSPIVLEYSELDVNLFSHNILSDLFVEIPVGNQIRSDQAAYDLSYFSIMTGGASGSLQFVNPDINYSGTAAKARTVNADFDLDTIFNFKNMNGHVNLTASKLDISNLRLASVPIPIAALNISGMKISALITDGNVKLDGTRIKVDVFDVQIRGSIKLNQSFNTSVLNVNVCINPVPGSDFDNSDIFGFYATAGGSAETGMCYLVSGSPASPSFVKQ